MWRVRTWKPESTPPAGASAASSADSPLRLGVLRIAKGLQSIGHGKREAGKGLALNLALRLGSQKADVDAVGGMLIASFGQDGDEIGRRGVEPGLKKRAVERSAVRNEQAQIAGGEARRELEGNANVALGLLPGTESGFDFHSVAGVGDISGDEVHLLERDQNPPGNRLNVEIDLANHALAGAVRVEARELLAGQDNGLHGSGRSGSAGAHRSSGMEGYPERSMLPVR